MGSEGSRGSGRSGPASAPGALVDALVAGDLHAAFAVVDAAAQAGLSPGELQGDLLAPAMDEVGRRWQCGEITVADEHLASAIATDVLVYLYPRVLTGPTGLRGRVLLATAEGERHTLGLRMTADLLDGVGFETIFLGGDVPVDALVDAVLRHRPAVLLLSVSRPEAADATLEVVRRLWCGGAGPRVVLGGPYAGALAARVRGATVVRRSDEAEAAVVEQLGMTEPIAVDDGAIAGPVHLRRRAEDRDPVSGLVTSNEVIADLVREQARRAHGLEELAYRDGLTSAWNRRALDDRLLAMCAEGRDGFVAMVDIDGFKAINDRYGHERGDQVLCGLRIAIEAATRRTDFVSRYGGDEFAVLLDGASEHTAGAVAERIRAAVADEFADLGATVSIGLAPLDGNPRSTALEADRNLYLAKEAGRDRVAMGGAVSR